jgi:hypothetical protein
MKHGRSTLISIIIISFLTLFSSMAAAQAIIEVSPSEHDYGDVVVGAESSTIITVTNVGSRILAITTMELTVNDEFQFLSSIWPPIELYPSDFVDIEVGFIPSTTGYFTTELVFGSNDPANPSVSVALSGTGVEETPPPQLEINDLILFLDEAADNGTIEGEGPEGSNAAQAHLEVFRNILWAASDLFAGGDHNAGCKALNRAMIRSDGLDKPKDFIVGEGVSILNAMIIEAMGLFGC